MTGSGATRPTLPPPLFGYNSSVRRGGRTFHVQTEDSGLGHPHVVTHIFAEGGRIVATLRSGYAEHTGDPQCAVLVRRMLVMQHREAFIALHEGRYDVGPESPAQALEELDAPTHEPAANGAAAPAAAPQVCALAELIGVDPTLESLDDVMLRDVALQLSGERG